MEFNLVLLREIVQMVEGSYLTQEAKLDLAIPFAVASDLMSDVLAYSRPHCLLLTGLANSHVIHTAEMADIAAIVFVRGKVPLAEVVEMAEEKGIPLITSPLSMYEMCGRLFQAGLTGCGMQSKA
jgi:predicted transcriptional regulator